MCPYGSSERCVLVGAVRGVSLREQWEVCPRGSSERCVLTGAVRGVSSEQ